MAFDNATNHGRVKKVLDTLALIEKSATSNDATQEELRQMLSPLYRHLGVAMSAEPERPEVPKPEEGRVGASAPPWASVMDMAREASLKDLNRALAIYLNRLDEEFSK